MKRKLIPTLMLAVGVGVLLVDKSFCYSDEKDFNYKNYINNITETAMEANVEINSQGYKKVNNNNVVTVSQGSGVIFNKTDNEYEILTNNHVVYFDITHYKTLYIITDYKGNEYEGELVKSSVAHDLAVIRIKDTYAMDLMPLELAKENPKIGDLVATIVNHWDKKTPLPLVRLENTKKLSLLRIKMKVMFNLMSSNTMHQQMVAVAGEH